MFIDYQNVYQGARGTFGWTDNHFVDGQVFPRRLALRLTDLGRSVDPARQLEYVRVFRGEPSAKHSPRGQAACQRQVEYWNAQAAVQAVTRPLKYYHRGIGTGGDPVFEPREKGIDVLIALHLVMGAMRDDYDTAVLMSGDSDLAPAIETVIDLGKRCEVASWQDRGVNRTRISVPKRNVWCHWLDRHDYELVADPTDYTKPHPGGVANAPG
ncbi:MAG: NYN domain-containing protein [Acidimicrobiia bacterium]